MIIDVSMLSNEWIAAPGETVTLKEVVVNVLRHFKLHIAEIDELIDKK